MSEVRKCTPSQTRALMTSSVIVFQSVQVPADRAPFPLPLGGPSRSPVLGSGRTRTLQLLHVRVAIHTDVGLVFVGLVVVHLAQRRRTLARMATQIVRARTLAGRRIRLTVSDFLLLFVTLNVLVSGVLDWGRAEPIQVPLPRPFGRWHLDSGLVLVICMAVHIWHRRKRLRRSAIR